MRCMADKHYYVKRHWADYQPYWKRDGQEPDGDIRALGCAFCDFEVRKQSVALKARTGLGRYNVMRGYMVAHLHEFHRDKLGNGRTE